MTEDTSAYWRKLLGLDKPPPGDALSKLKSPHRILRPLIFFIFSILARFVFPIKVYGLENLPEEGPYIIASNHASAIDYLTVAYAVGPKARKNLHPLATKLYYDNPFARFFMLATANVIRIDTEEDFFPALREAGSVLRLGEKVCIYPEGTRTENKELLPFRVGVGILSVETGVPIVPVYVKDTMDVLPTGALMFKSGRIVVSFGKPIDPKPYFEKKRTAQAYDVYKENTEELRKRIIKLRKSSI